MNYARCIKKHFIENTALGQKKQRLEQMKSHNTFMDKEI